MSKNIKISDYFSINKVAGADVYRSYLTVDSDGKLEVSTKTGAIGGIVVKGASSVSEIEGSVVISGDLTVSGTTTTLDTQNLTVEDKNIIIANVAVPTDVTADGAGITVMGTTNKTITWTDSTNSWDFNQQVRTDSIAAVTTNSDLTISANGSGDVIVNDILEVNNGVKTDTIESLTTDTDLTLSGNGTGVVKISDSLGVDSITAYTTDTDLTLSGNGTGIVKVNDNLDITGDIIISGTIPAANVEYDNTGVTGSLIFGTFAYNNAQDLLDEITLSNYAYTFVTFADADVQLTATESKTMLFVVVGGNPTAIYDANAVLSIVNPGTGYAVNDTITLTGGVFEDPVILEVTGETAGVIDTVSIVDPGIYTTKPANPVAQGSTSGVGVNATFNIEWKPTYRRLNFDNNVLVPPKMVVNFMSGPFFIGRTSNVITDCVLVQSAQTMTVCDVSGAIGEFTPTAPGINDRIQVDFYSDNNRQIAPYEASRYRIDITDSGTVLTAPRDLIYMVPLLSIGDIGVQVVTNNTAQTITYKSNGQPGVAIAPSETVVTYYDGTDINKIPIKILDDTAPQLGGNLDVNGNDIVSVSNGDINILPNGSGKIKLDQVFWPTTAGSTGDVLKTDGTDASWATIDLDFLSDVTISGGGEGDFLIRKETGWVNSSYSKIYETTFNTTDDTSTVVTFEGEAISIPSNKVASFEAFVIGYRTGGVGAGSTGDCAYARIHGGIKNVGGTTTIIGTNNDHSHFDDAGWSITAVANNANDTLDITVKGDTDTNITWTVSVYLHIMA